MKNYSCKNLEKGYKVVMTMNGFQWKLPKTCVSDGITLVYNLYITQKSVGNLIQVSIFEHCAYSYVVHCTDTAPYIYIQQNSAELCS